MVVEPEAHTRLGAWKALHEAGVQIRGIAGTSVGALNGALICMGDVDEAEHIWKEMTFFQGHGCG